MTSLSAASVVAGREIKTRLRSKAFVITGIILIALVLLGTLFGPRVAESLTSGGSSDTTVAISQDVVDASNTAEPHAGLDAVPGLELAAQDRLTEVGRDAGAAHVGAVAGSARLLHERGCSRSNRLPSGADTSSNCIPQGLRK